MLGPKQASTRDVHTFSCRRPRQNKTMQTIPTRIKRIANVALVLKTATNPKRSKTHKCTNKLFHQMFSPYLSPYLFLSTVFISLICVGFRSGMETVVDVDSQCHLQSMVDYTWAVDTVVDRALFGLCGLQSLGNL